MENKENKAYYKYNMQGVIIILVGIVAFAVPFSVDIISVVLKISSVIAFIVGALMIREKVYDVKCPNCGKSFAFSYDAEADTCVHCQKRILKTEKGFCCADNIETNNSKAE